VYELVNLPFVLPIGKKNKNNQITIALSENIKLFLEPLDRLYFEINLEIL
jgi:hypothetical protein